MRRRDFTKGAATIAASAFLAEAQEESSVPTVYFVDGYHGGAIGHMPAGSWRDILNTLRDLPQWKVSLDIEPISWDLLRRQDPLAYAEWKKLLNHNDPLDSQVEMVGFTFAQPYGWAINGESNIRQLTRGRQVVLRNFPQTVVSTYAVQEPCWASCLPQILLSLGFSGAVLKDPGTAWGGYAAGFDAETVNWVGPDGSVIVTVPRYACEALQKVYETEAADVKPAFARKCVALGIPHPAGTYLQDLGWSAKPKVAADYIRYTTWREYLATVATKPSHQWRFGIEDILTTLPWGEKTLQGVAQQVRSAENKLLAAEKLAAMCWLEHRTAWPAAELQSSWDELLYAQAHDAWITATTRFGRQAWAFHVASGTLRAEDSAGQILASCAQVISTGSGATEPDKRLGAQWVRVMNTLGSARTDLAEVAIGTDRGTLGLRMFDGAGKEIPIQVIETRKYVAPAERSALSRAAQVGAPGSRASATGDINAATVLFLASTPALGYSTYRIEPVYGSQPVQMAGACAAAFMGEEILIESDLYRIRLSPKRGGCIMSLFAKELQKEFCEANPERLFNEYRGYFSAAGQWHSSAESPAQVTILEKGPLRARVRVAGKIGSVPFQTTITLVSGQRRIDFQTRITYVEDTWIGDPWDIKPENRRSERRRSQNDGRPKLQAFFPLNLGKQAIYKNAAYDVCRSRNADTFFQGWDEIKHNIICGWVDAVDESEKLGLAVLSDHTTAYTHGPDHPLALVLGWGGEGGFWWAKCPLRGTQQIGYGIVPHRGLWHEANLWEEDSRWNEPMLTQLMEGVPQPETNSRSLVSVSGAGVEVPTMLIDGGALLVRLFNAEGGSEERSVSFATQPRSVDVVELDGRVASRLEIRRGNSGRYECSLALPRFGLRTLRCEFPQDAGA